MRDIEFARTGHSAKFLEKIIAIAAGKGGGKVRRNLGIVPQVENLLTHRWVGDEKLPFTLLNVVCKIAIAEARSFIFHHLEPGAFDELKKSGRRGRARLGVGIERTLADRGLEQIVEIHATALPCPVQGRGNRLRNVGDWRGHGNPTRAGDYG